MPRNTISRGDKPGRLLPDETDRPGLYAPTCLTKSEQRGFACAVGADDRNDRSRWNIDIDPPEDLNIAIARLKFLTLSKCSAIFPNFANRQAALTGNVIIRRLDRSSPHLGDTRRGTRKTIGSRGMAAHSDDDYRRRHQEP